MRRIETLDDIERGLDALCAADARLVAVREIAGQVPLRLSEPGLASLVNIVVSQQVSRASADAIFRRLTQLLQPLTAEMLARADDALHRQAGMSRPKQRTLDALARAVLNGLDLEALCSVDAETAMGELCAVPGIGRWTAEVYLLSCAGHPDVFPARDVALQSAVGHALGFELRPGEKSLIALAESWSPWRSVAARLFWSYYRTMRGREGAPVGPEQGNG